jgi:sodium/proline symporter
MTCALIVITVFGVVQAGGIDVVVENAKALPGYLSFTEIHDVATGTAKPYSVLNIASMFAWGLGYFGMPHILVRFMAIRDENELTLSRRIASIWVVISMTVAVCIGMIGYSVSKAGRMPMLEGSNSETVVVQISNLLSTYGIFAAIVAGLILAGILAATMSTADSQLLSAASAFSENLLGDVFGVKLNAKQNMLAARLTVIVIAVIAAFLATDPNSSVFKIVSFAWAGFGATFGPAILFSLFWKRTTSQGVLAGLVAGGAMVFIWKFGISKLGGAFAIYELLPAFVVAAIVIVVVSLVTPKPSAEVERIFDEMKAQ